MKTKHFKLIAVAAAALLAVSCGSKAIEGFENYKEACDAGRYDVANRFLGRMKEAAVSDWEARLAYEEASEHVFREELLYLISMGDETSINRILLLFKQRDLGHDAMIRCSDDAISLAISLKNTAMLDRLIVAYPEKDFSETTINKIISYYTLMPDQLKAFYLDNMECDEVRKLAVNHCNATKDADILKKLIVVDPDLRLNVNIMRLWADIDYPSYVSQIDNIINDAEAKVPALPVLGLVKSDPYGELEENYREYISLGSELNNLIITIMTIAKEHGDTAVATKAFNRMKTGLSYKNLGDWCRVVEKQMNNSSVYRAYQVSENKDDINRARRLL